MKTTPIRRTRILGISIAAILALTAAAAATSASGANAQRWIVFSGTTDSTSTAQLYRIDTAGGGLKQITRGTKPAIAPSFAPDGKSVLFARLGSGIFSVNLDGTGLRRITSNGRDSYPTYDPTGKQIAFLRPHTHKWSVYVIPAAGKPPRLLKQAPLASRPSWTKRGLLVPSEGDLIKIDPRTGKILEYLDAEIDPVWGLNQTEVSPDSSTITFVGSRHVDVGDMECGEGPCQRFALYIEDLRGKKSPRMLLKDGGPATFSADGQRVVIIAKNGLVLWSLANGTSKTLTTGKVYPTVATPAAWQPR